MKDRKGNVIFLILTIIMLISVPTAARLLRELVEVYKFNFTAIPNNYILSIIKDVNTYKGFLKFNHPVNLIGLVIIAWFTLSYILGRLGIFKIHDKYEQIDNYGSHGTSRWQSKNEMKEDYTKNKIGWFLGGFKENEMYKLDYKGAYHSINNPTNLNMQTIVIGPPGSNKTTGFVLPNIFSIVDAYKMENEKIDIVTKKMEQMNPIYKSIYKLFNKNMNLNKEMPDLIITDPKPELFPLTANYLIKNNYDIKVLDFIDLKYGDCLNPFDFITDDKTLMEIAQGYIDAVGGAEGKNGGDQQFWNDQEAQVLAALMGFVMQKYPKERQNFGELSKILVSDDVSDIDSARYFFKDNDITGAPVQLWNNFLMLADSERTRANILGGLAEKLKLFSIQGIKDITSKTTVDISKLGTKKDKPMAIFILMPDGDRTFSPIINVTITSIFKQLYKTARNTQARLEMPVYYILEEMANIGKIPNIIEMLGTMRGRRIYPMMIWQSLSQMKQRYGDKGFEDIMSQCDTHIYLGINDQFTAKYCSDSLGPTTIRIQGISNKADDGILTLNEKSESKNYNGRSLLDPSECRRMDNNKMIVIQRAKNPCLMYKVQYRYWQYTLSTTKDIKELNIINNSNENFNEVKNVINITRENEKERAINETEPNVDDDIIEEEEKEVNNSLVNATLDKEALKCFTKKDNDFDLEI